MLLFCRRLVVSRAGQEVSLCHLPPVRIPCECSLKDGQHLFPLYRNNTEICWIVLVIADIWSQNLCNRDLEVTVAGFWPVLHPSTRGLSLCFGLALVFRLYFPPWFSSLEHAAASGSLTEVHCGAKGHHHSVHQTLPPQPHTLPPISPSSGHIHLLATIAPLIDTPAAFMFVSLSDACLHLAPFYLV